MTSIEFLMQGLSISPQKTTEIVEAAEQLRKMELELARQQGIQEGIDIMRTMLNPNTTGNEQ